MEEIQQIIDELLAGTTVEIQLKITFKPTEPAESDKKHRVTCEKCGWTRAYTSRSSAKRGLRSHVQHCTGHVQHVQVKESPTAWIEAMSQDT